MTEDQTRLREELIECSEKLLVHAMRGSVSADNENYSCGVTIGQAFQAAGLLRRAAEAGASAPPAQDEIDCPLCGQRVGQVASATLSLALWQHVNWACQASSPLRRGEGWQPIETAPKDDQKPVLCWTPHNKKENS